MAKNSYWIRVFSNNAQPVFLGKITRDFSKLPLLWSSLLLVNYYHKKEIPELTPLIFQNLIGSFPEWNPKSAYSERLPILVIQKLFFQVKVFRIWTKVSIMEFERSLEMFVQTRRNRRGG